MRNSDGTHVLAANGYTTQFAINGTVATTTFDTFHYVAADDLWVADNVNVTIRFTSPTTFQGSSGGVGYSGVSS